jgi:tetratricopeptide (TPR) repeat protein
VPQAASPPPPTVAPAPLAPAAPLPAALPAPGGTVRERGTGFEITPAARQQLRHLQEQWLAWIAAGDRERSQAAVSQMLTIAGQLGMTRLADLALGALAQAVDAARHHDFVRASWSLEAAERLDPGRPETAFAEAAVARAEGSWLRLAGALCRGYPRLFWLPLERYLWLQDLLIWTLYLLLATGALFVGALMATRGAGLLHDLAGLLGRGSAGVGAVLAVAALLLPLALPGGLLWAPLWWSLLLWGYASSSERAVLIAVWLLLGATPLLVSAQRRAVAVRLSPPVRALESLQQRRLYGGLFTDLGLLRSALPDSPAVKHLLADVHRGLGQWDLARGLYQEVVEAEPQNAAALLNLGVYSFNRGDTTSAIQYFQQASAADPRNAAAAQFDLSQAYGEAYSFDEAHRALAQAKTLDAERVDRWVSNAEQEKLVTASGGLALIPSIERGLTGPAAGLDLIQDGASLAVAGGAVLLAIALHLARRQRGYSEARLHWRLGHQTLDRWRRALIPGLSAAETGEGVRAYLGLLVPVALLMLPLFERLGYSIPWGYDAGSFAAWIVSIGGLAVYLALRLLLEQRNAV